MVERRGGAENDGGRQQPLNQAKKTKPTVIDKARDSGTWKLVLV